MDQEELLKTLTKTLNKKQSKKKMLTDYSATSHRKHGKSTQTGQNVAKCHPKKMSEKLCETAKWSDNYNDD